MLEKNFKFSNRTIFGKIRVKISNGVVGINTVLHEYEGLLTEDKTVLPHFVGSICQIITWEI